MKKINVALYTRDNCTLCKEAYYLLLWLADQYPIELHTIEITSDPELEVRFALEIPVVEVNGEIIAISLIEEGMIRQYLDGLLAKQS